MATTYGKDTKEIYICTHQSTNSGECYQPDKGSGNHVAEEQVKKWRSLA